MFCFYIFIFIFSIQIFFDQLSIHDILSVQCLLLCAFLVFLCIIVRAPPVRYNDVSPLWRSPDLFGVFLLTFFLLLSRDLLYEVTTGSIGGRFVGSRLSFA